MSTNAADPELGSVDISQRIARPLASRGEQDKAQIAGRGLLIARGNTAALLEPADGPLHDVALPVQHPAVVDRLPPDASLPESPVRPPGPRCTVAARRRSSSGPKRRGRSHPGIPVHKGHWNPCRKRRRSVCEPMCSAGSWQRGCEETSLGCSVEACRLNQSQS